MHRHMRTHLHKDSLARQQQEQQLKSLVGASISAVAAAVASNSPLANTTPLATTTTTSPQSLSLNPTSPVGCSPLVHSESSKLTPGNLSTHASQHQRLNSIADPSINLDPQQSSAVGALLNQHLVAAFKQQSLANKQQSRTTSIQAFAATANDLAQNISALAGEQVSSLALANLAGENPSANFLLQQQQLEPAKALMMGAMQGDQLGLESFKAVMLAAAAAAAVSQQQQNSQVQSAEHSEHLNQMTPLDEKISMGSQISRGKRRKQINPRSSRAHLATTSSLNSDDSDQDQHSVSDEQIQADSPRQTQSSADDSMDHAPAVGQSSHSASQLSNSEKDNDDEDGDKQHSIVEDFNNNNQQDHTNNVGQDDEDDDSELNRNSLHDNIKVQPEDTDLSISSHNEQEQDYDDMEQDDDEEEDSYGANVNYNQDNISNSHESLIGFNLNEQQVVSMNSQENFAGQQHQNQKLTNQDSLNQELLTSVNGEIIEDVSQSYVKTANPNAARKGGKRNRHCYKCKLCTYSSVDRCTLVRHLRIHSGERPYICGICRYAFTTKANCERHVRKRHKKQYNSLGGAGGGGVKGSNGGGRSLIITDHSNHQTIPVKVNPVAAKTISQTLQRIQEKQAIQSEDEERDHFNTETDNNNIQRIPNEQQQIHHHSQMLPFGVPPSISESMNASEFKQNKRKHRMDLDLLDNQDLPNQRRRYADKQDNISTNPNRGARQKNLNSSSPSFNSRPCSFNLNPETATDLPSTNELFANLMAQLHQVTSTSGQFNLISQTALDAPRVSTEQAMLESGSTYVSAGKSASASDTQQPLGISQQSLLSPAKHLSQQFAQLRNLNSQSQFFIRRNPFDPFNSIDLAAQALDLSCKFQTSK